MLGHQARVADIIASVKSDYALVAFDLDDTLAPSKSPLPEPVAHQLRRLLNLREVCIISGGNIEQFRSQVLEHLEATESQLGRLHLMPTCGTRYCRWAHGTWHDVYAHNLPADVRARIIQLIESEARALGLWENQPWGPIIEDRQSQITYSALGQEAPLDKKKAWDPRGEKKEALRTQLAGLLPDLEVRSGGSTSVDITMKGVDKAYGIRHLAEKTGIAIADMLFVGDRLDEGGNDYPVIATGIDTYAVTGWEDTVSYLEKFCSAIESYSQK